MTSRPRDRAFSPPRLPGGVAEDDGPGGLFRLDEAKQQGRYDSSARAAAPHRRIDGMREPRGAHDAEQLVPGPLPEEGLLERAEIDFPPGASGETGTARRAIVPRDGEATPRRVRDREVPRLSLIHI